MRGTLTHITMRVGAAADALIALGEVRGEDYEAVTPESVF